MKIRNGFVSNSSSSSFIIALDDDYDREQMSEILFKGQAAVVYEYAFGDSDDILVTEQLMDVVDSQFRVENKITTYDQFKNAYSIGYNEGPEWPTNTHALHPDDRKVVWDEHHRLCEEYKDRVCKQLWKKYKSYAKEGRLYSIEFYDNEGRLGSHLEHGVGWLDYFEGMCFLSTAYERRCGTGNQYLEYSAGRAGYGFKRTR